MSRVIALLFAAAVSIPTVALADIAPEPCESAEVGDSCETANGEAGSCEEGTNGLVCEPSEDSDGSDDGCSASSASSGTLPGMALVMGAAIAFFAIKRRKPS